MYYLLNDWFIGNEDWNCQVINIFLLDFFYTPRLFVEIDMAIIPSIDSFEESKE